MTLLNPIWLWALGGLAIPVAIHLLSRKEGKTIRMGSIRFLTETATHKFSSIRINEMALLAIRSLLIMLMVLFLASVLITPQDSGAIKKWVVIEKGFENNNQLRNLLDSLQQDGYEIRRLATGFPLPDQDTVTQPPDYYKLSEDLSEQADVEAVVIAGNLASNFKGKRMGLPHNITWLSYPPTTAQNMATDLPSGDTIRILIAYDKEFQYDKKIMSAALQTLQPAAPANFIITETEVRNLNISGRTDWLIWLSTGSAPYIGKSLRFFPDEIHELIIQNSRTEWILTKRLSEENAVEQHLAIQLMNMLFNEPINTAIRKNDKRTLPDELVWVKNDTPTFSQPSKAGQPADRILIVLIVLTFIAERVFAFYRKQ